MPVLQPDALIDTLVENIRKYHRNAGIDRAELDLSGGIDSAVMLGLLTLALGADNLTVPFLGITSNPDALARASGIASALGVKLIEFDGSALFNLYLASAKDAMRAAGYDEGEIDTRITRDPTILGSIRSTMRAPWGRGFCRLAGNGIRHGTGNECEDRWLRFYQKGGDGEVDTNPISMLSKGEVYQLARALGRRLNAVDAYERIITAVPSADLWGVADNHNDQSEVANYLGVQGYPVYSQIDAEGDYRSLGLVERVSRWLDAGGWSHTLFADTASDEEINTAVLDASVAPEFEGVAGKDIDALVRAARRIERMTRHKLNPNCPALTTREYLRSAGILSDSLVFTV